MRVQILPEFAAEDKGDGGIRRVVEAQYRYLGDYGIEVVTHNPDLVAIHGGQARSIDYPTVAHCHGLYWTPYKWSTWAHELNRAVINSMRIANKITVPSKWVSKILQRGMWVDPTVIYHGIDSNEWLPGTDQGYVLWNKTRVDAICDPTPVNELAQRAPAIQFVSTFGAKAPNVRLTNRLPFDQAKVLIQNAGVYLCTSRETFGIGTLEAMSCGVPILGWNFGGQAEIITHKVNGYLCAPDDYEDLREGLDYCFNNRSALGEAARQTVIDKFAWPDKIEQYADVYKTALESTTIKVSVIVTCYNLATLLPRMLDSLIAQTMQDWECIVVNDASPDNTIEVVASYTAKDPRIRIHTNEQNLYLAGALNAGIACARGQYIIPIDADNELAPNALAILSQALDRDRELMIVYGSMEVVESDGKRSISGWPPETFNYSEQMQHRNQISSTAMFRKRVWETIGGYRRRCRTAEDADFWCRATSYGFKPAKVTQEITLIYHNREDSMSHVETDWPWNQWYTWYKDTSIAPITTPLQQPNVPLYEPAKVSVIIPVGPGHENLLLDAIDSVNGQTLLEWECIVVDDTGGKVGWLPPFVKLLSTGKVGAGPSVARNIGIAASTAPLFVPLDADDYLQSDALAELVVEWQKYGGYVYTDWIKQESRELQTTPEFDCTTVLQKLHHAVTAIYPYAAWKEVGGFDENLPAWEDWDFVIAITNAGYCGTRLPRPLFQYRMNSGFRRESMFQNKEELKQYIFAKWKTLIEGDNMPCGGCGKGGNRRITQPQDNTARVAAPPNNDSDVVMLEFVLMGSPPLTYVGPITRTPYRFGSDPGHRVRYVFRKDAIEFLKRKEFKLAGGSKLDADILQAAGPPVRS